MLRRITMITLFAIVLAVSAQAASADPLNAKTAAVFTANCGAAQVLVVVNGEGEFTPAHVIGSTVVPTAFDLTFSFTATGGAIESETDTSAKAHQLRNAVTCDLPAALNLHEPGRHVHDLRDLHRRLHAGD